MKLLRTFVLSMVFVGMAPSIKADWWLKFDRKNITKVSKITGAGLVFGCAALRSIHSILLIWGLASGKAKIEKGREFHPGAKFFAINDAVFNAALAAFIAYETVAYVWPEAVNDDDNNDNTDKSEEPGTFLDKKE